MTWQCRAIPQLSRKPIKRIESRWVFHESHLWIWWVLYMNKKIFHFHFIRPTRYFNDSSIRQSFEYWVSFTSCLFWKLWCSVLLEDLEEIVFWHTQNPRGADFSTLLWGRNVLSSSDKLLYLDTNIWYCPHLNQCDLPFTFFHNGLVHWLLTCTEKLEKSFSVYCAVTGETECGVVVSNEERTVFWIWKIYLKVMIAWSVGEWVLWCQQDIFHGFSNLKKVESAAHWNWKVLKSRAKKPVQKVNASLWNKGVRYTPLAWKCVYTWKCGYSEC